jgi:hypothetical protein
LLNLNKSTFIFSFFWTQQAHVEGPINPQNIWLAIGEMQNQRWKKQILISFLQWISNARSTYQHGISNKYINEERIHD